MSHLPESRLGVKMEKSFLDHIMDGSIVIKSVEAFNSALKEFPDHPELLKMHADFLAHRGIRQAAAQQYNHASQLFLSSGRLFQAWFSKILQWQLQKPSREELIKTQFVVESLTHNGAPVDVFIQGLAPQPRVAVFSQFKRIVKPAGKTILKAGEQPACLYIVVSGVLKESSYQMVAQKPRFHRQGSRILKEEDIFGDIYPFTEDITTQSYVQTVTRTELMAISRRRLMLVCRRYPEVERGIIRLCRVRCGKKDPHPSDIVRMGERYPIPAKMSVEILPGEENDPPIVLNGHSQCLSVSGVSFIPESNGFNENLDEKPEWQSIDGDLITRRVRVSIPNQELSVAILGRIVRKSEVMVNGYRTPCFGIQFAEMPPRLRGAFFAFAEGAKDAIPASDQLDITTSPV
jgi:hypothetical protein